MTTYLDEEGPLLIIALPTEEIWAGRSSQEKKNLSHMQPPWFIIPCCQNTPKISHTLSARHCREGTRFDNHLFVDFGIYIVCDKYPVRQRGLLAPSFSTWFSFLVLLLIPPTGLEVFGHIQKATKGHRAKGGVSTHVSKWKATPQLQRRDV